MGREVHDVIGAAAGTDLTLTVSDISVNQRAGWAQRTPGWIPVIVKICCFQTFHPVRNLIGVGIINIGREKIAPSNVGKVDRMLTGRIDLRFETGH